MPGLTKRATVYLDPALHKALRLKSVDSEELSYKEKSGEIL